MKKILLIILLILFTGCSNSEDSMNLKIYKKYIDDLSKITESSKNIPFDIAVQYSKLDDEEVMYQVIIDNPIEDIYSIEAIAIHDKETDDIFPSIGIFDDREKLEVGKKPSGIILVGYLDYNGDINDFECEMKVLVKYKINNINKKVYYVTKK